MDLTERQLDWLEENFFNQVPAPEFFKEIQGRRCARAKLSPAGLNRLPTWNNINSFLSDHRLTHPRVRISLEGAVGGELNILSARNTLRGEPISDVLPERVYANLRAGATLVLDSIDAALPSAREIASSITKHFLAKAQANAYLTFGERRGFGLHWDDHDVFIVQIHGRKTWNLYGMARLFPMHRDFHNDHKPPTEIVESLILEPGSILYVPRGCWHDVIGVGEPTLHLTIGVTASTGIDMLDWLRDEARGVEFFRQDVPLHQPDKHDEYANNFAAQLEKLLSIESTKRFFDERKRSIRPYPRFSFPYGITKSYSPDGSELIRIVPDTYNLNYTNAKILIEANNRLWTLPSGLRSVIEALHVGKSITVEAGWQLVRNNFDGLLRDEWLVFLEDLITQGLFYFAASDSASNSRSQ